MTNSEIMLVIEEKATELWQGRGTNVNAVSDVINMGIDNILNDVPKMKAAGIDFPLEYVSGAMKNLSNAVQLRDDYLLADNLYFEWREIFQVFDELMAEI